MATVIIGERREGSGSVSISGNSLAFRATYKYLVLSDDISVSREEVLFSTPNLPIVGLSYSIASGAICTSVNAARSTENAYYWEVTCEFDTSQETQRQDPANPSNDPTTWLPVFKIESFETKNKVLEVDFAGLPIVNSAGDKFETPLVKSLSLCSFSFVQFEHPGQDIDQILDHNNVVNETTFLNREPRTLKLNVTAAELGVFGGFAAWKVSYKCTYDPDNWDVEMLDYGTNYLVGGVRTSYEDEKFKYKIYGPLDGAGGKAAGDAETLYFEVFEKVEFADFIRV